MTLHCDCTAFALQSLMGFEAVPLRWAPSHALIPDCLSYLAFSRSLQSFIEIDFIDDLFGPFVFLLSIFE